MTDDEIDAWNAEVDASAARAAEREQRWEAIVSRCLLCKMNMPEDDLIQGARQFMQDELRKHCGLKLMISSTIHMCEVQKKNALMDGAHQNYKHWSQETAWWEVRDLESSRCRQAGEEGSSESDGAGFGAWNTNTFATTNQGYQTYVRREAVELSWAWLITRAPTSASASCTEQPAPGSASAATGAAADADAEDAPERPGSASDSALPELSAWLSADPSDKSLLILVKCC